MPPLIGTSFSGGRDLGHARGAITIDTAGLAAAERESQRAGRSIGRNLEQGIGRGAQAAGRAIGGLASGIRSFQGELAAIGGAGALATLFGTRAARNLRAYSIRFRQFTGDAESATALIEQLADNANEFGLQLEGTLKLASSLLPILEGNTEATQEWVTRAARLRSVFPTAQEGAEVRAISEFLAGQTMSLQRLFNIPPELIQEAQRQFEDAGQQMEFILDRMGATEQAAREMADPIVAVKNELQLIGAIAFTPLLEDIREGATEFREWLQTVRETQPELLQVGAKIAAIATVGAPGLLFLGRLLETLQKINVSRIRGPLIVGGVAVGGAIAAREGLQAIGRSTGDERLSNISFTEMLRTAIMAVVDIIYSFGGAIWLALNSLVDIIASAVGALGRLVQRIGSIIPDVHGGERIRTEGEEISEFAEQLKEANDQAMPAFKEGLLESRRRVQDFVNRLFGIVPAVREHLPRGRPAQDGAGATAAGDQFSDEQVDAITDWYEAIQQIEEQENAARLEATQQYEEQRTSIIAQFELQIAREAEDFARRRRRQEQQLQDDIAKIRADQAEREREWAEELAETIAEARADSAERIAEIEERFNDRRERLQRDHRRNLLDAAARLDASAVAQENRRFRDQTDDLEDDLERRLKQERENLEERIEQAQDAHEERVREARKSDEERIRDLKENLRERQRIEDEDRAIRLQRMREDHQRQLQEFDNQHQSRLQQIQQNAVEERNELADAFNDQLNQLGINNELWLEEQERLQDDSLDLFEEYWESIERIQRSLETDDGGITPGGFQSGGFVTHTGAAMLHGSPSRPEYVLDPDTTAMVRGMLGDRFTQPDLVGAVAGGSTSTTLTVSEGAIQIHAAPGQSPADIGMAVRNEFAALLRELA